jgi:hypothetical protein
MPDESIAIGRVSFLRVTSVLDADTCEGCRAAHGKVIVAVNELAETICDKVKDGTGTCRCTTEPVQPKRGPMFYMDGK